MRCLLVAALTLAAGCSSCSSPKNPPAGVGSGGTGGADMSSPGSGGDGRSHTGGSPATPAPIPGADSCQHPDVVETCAEGWCRIPAGCFIMGSPGDEWGHPARTENQVAVTITRDFEMQQTEVTQQGWLELVDNNPTSVPDETLTVCLDNECPVTHVTWFEALEYANRLSLAHEPPLAPCYELEGCSGEMGAGRTCTGARLTTELVQACAGYRLPTDAEFEYATRAGTKTAFYSGEITRHDVLFACNPDSNLERIGWYCYNAERRARPVGHLEPNAWGLYDMAGNIREFVGDAWTGLSFREAQTDPGGTLEVVEARTERSCGALSDAWTCRSASKILVNAHGGPTTGLRLVRTLLE